MKNKSWTKYLVYLLLIFALIYLDGYIWKRQAIYQGETFKLGFVYFVISMIIKIGIGSLLGLEYIINEIKKEGIWKINLPKMILMVIPSFYFSISYFMYGFIDNSIYRILMYPNFMFIRNDSGFVYIFQLMLGYFLITSLFKKSKDIKNETII